jgi:hypothetical protein
MDGPVLLFAWLTLVISWVAFPFFSFSFVTFTCLPAIYPRRLIPLLDAQPDGHRYRQGRRLRP